MRSSLLLVLVALLGAAGVILAAVGAHLPGLADDSLRYRSWQSASLIHLVHVPVLLLLALQDRSGWRAPAWAMLAGVLAFSGSIYAAGLVGQARPGPIAPIGGMLLIGSWLWLAVAGWRASARG